MRCRAPRRTSWRCAPAATMTAQSSIGAPRRARRARRAARRRLTRALAAAQKHQGLHGAGRRPDRCAVTAALRRGTHDAEQRAAGTGKGGASIWGGKFPDEIRDTLKVRRSHAARPLLQRLTHRTRPHARARRATAALRARHCVHGQQRPKHQREPVLHNVWEARPPQRCAAWRCVAPPPGGCA
jgi:hypothetical protein